MLRIGVLVSGGGTNLQAVIDNIESGCLPKCSLVTVVSSREDAYALKRAEKHNIPVVCLLRKGFDTLADYDKALISHLNSYKVDLVVLAGFMTILGNDFISAFRNKIINVHPALIPSFCGKGYYGLKPHIAAIAYGVKVSGATVHFVELDTDAGPIILQKAVDVKQDDTPETLQKRVMEEAEQKILPEAIKLISEGRVTVVNRNVMID